MQINKLVRDEIPAIIAEEDNKIVTFRKLDKDEFVQALHRKLDEEVDEFHRSGDMEELADILEVIYEFTYVTGNDPKVLEKVRQNKARHKGGFVRRYFLEKVEEREEPNNDEEA